MAAAPACQPTPYPNRGPSSPLTADAGFQHENCLNIPGKNAAGRSPPERKINAPVRTNSSNVPASSLPAASKQKTITEAQTRIAAAAQSAEYPFSASLRIPHRESPADTGMAKSSTEARSSATIVITIDQTTVNFTSPAARSLFPKESVKGNATQLKTLWIRTSHTVRLLISDATSGFTIISCLC